MFVTNGEQSIILLSAATGTRSELCYFFSQMQTEASNSYIWNRNIKKKRKEKKKKEKKRIKKDHNWEKTGKTKHILLT